MATQGASKLLTFTNVAPQVTVSGKWNNANAEVYHLNAWPKVAPGVTASAEITKIRSVGHGSPPERDLHFSVKNTGTTTIDIDVWAFWWNMPFRQTLEDVRKEFGVPAVGGATVTKEGIQVLEVAGIRKHGNDTPVEVGDRWHLGSDTKAMTATLLGVLVQKGVVGWDLTVPQAFPEWNQTMKERFKEASFERLMAHRSGILNVSADEGAALTDMSKSAKERRLEFTRLIVHREHSEEGLLFDAPGFIYRYQNANFIVAAAMIERRTGKSWEELMKTEIFQPLGMTTAGFGAPGSANDVKEPYGHSDASGQRVASKGDNPPALGPAGTVHASLRDWARFISLHLDGSEGSLTLAQATLKCLHTEYETNNIYPERYGWGWIIFDADGGVGLGHDGSNNLWYCSCQLLLKKGVGFLAVTNIGGDSDTIKNGKGNFACWKVIEKLREQYFE
jgi:CubicO group peptidase (beta-lactamase class C family)